MPSSGYCVQIYIAKIIKTHARSSSMIKCPIHVMYAMCTLFSKQSKTNKYPFAMLRFSELRSLNSNTNLSAQQELETGSDAANCEVKCNYGLVSKARHEAYIYQQC